MFVDAIIDRKKDKILVAERINGERILTEFDANYVFYYDHPQGSNLSIFGDPCRKFTTTDSKKFRKELMRTRSPFGAKNPVKIFESDINPVFRCLADNYMGVDAPKLNVGFFDIEVDFDPDRGFAPVTDPFNAITAISLHLSHINRLISLVLCPKTVDFAEGTKICEEFEDTFLFNDEKELLRTFLELIDEADVLSGWNSTGFDIPYIVNRIQRIMDSDTTRALCLWNQKPREREYLKFKRKHKTYDLVGRVHLDYLDLYQKHNPQQLHSYRLDYVAEVEVGDNKTVYEGTLDQLYNYDFKRFIEYNRQDTMLLVKIDAKKKFIELANQIAHANCVLLKTTMGSVSLVETAIINEMHAMGFVVPDRKPKFDEEYSPEDRDEDDEDDEGRTPVVGAYVAKPKTGIHEEVGCVDINSLYPSCIRALNMSPETIVGQVRIDETMALVAERIARGVPRAEAWDGIFCALEVDHMHARDGAPLTIDFEDGVTRTMSGRDLFDYVYNPRNQVCITANGTLFSTRKDGIIPMLLAKWYAERQEMQGKQVEFEDLAAAETDADKKADYKYWAGFWNQRQQARKILLNSLYGALLNEGLRFYDERLGQSVTLTGRSIVRHMNAKINEIIAGEYDYMGDAICYADTDSCYFSAAKILKNDPRYVDFEWTRENIISLYDVIADSANDSFPEFMHKTFNTTLERGGIIKAGRELVASTALFIKKKKYAVLMYDKDGKRLDKDGKPGKLKAMGLDLKRSDTPKYMQEFLESLLMNILTGAKKEDMFEDIRKFRKEFVNRPGWEKGSPKKVSALMDYTQRFQKGRDMTLEQSLKMTKGEKAKVNVPGHVRASMNWNQLCESNNDRYSMRIGDGAKIIVCKLKANLMGMTSVAYPIDEPHIPAWFKALPFDHRAMEDVIIDNKLDNLVGVLKWDLSKTKDAPADEFFSW
jgi:DNA polymerase elongation subunit (family B)